MKRDLALIAEILIKIEESREGVLAPVNIVDGSDPLLESISYNMWLAADAGFLGCQDPSVDKACRWYHLTMKGHDKVESIRARGRPWTWEAA